MRESEKRQLTIILTFTFILIFLIQVCIAYFVYKKYFYKEKGELIAVVGNTKIYDNDIKNRLKFLENIEVDNKNEAIETVLYEAYIDNILLKEVKKKNNRLDKNELENLILENEKQIIKYYFLKNNVLSQIKEEDIKAKYNESIKLVEDQEERKISYILLETEEEANRIRKNIFRFDNFEYQASQFSLDKISGLKGGDLGYLLKSEIKSKIFKDIAFLLKKDEISKPIQLEDGWAIIKVVDIRTTELKSYDNIKDAIKIQLENEVVKKYFDKLVFEKKINIINNNIFNVIKEKTVETNNIETKSVETNE